VRGKGIRPATQLKPISKRTAYVWIRGPEVQSAKKKKKKHRKERGLFEDRYDEELQNSGLARGAGWKNKEKVPWACYKSSDRGYGLWRSGQYT